MRLSFEITLPPEAIKVLLENKPWTGSVEVTAKQKRGRKDTIRKEQIKKAFSFTEEDYQIIDAWNLHPIVVAGEEAFRGKNLPTNKTEALHTKLRAVLKKYSVDEILSFMQQYFSAIESGKHQRFDFNPAYKSLDGFLEKLYKVKRDKIPAWWMSEDTAVTVSDPHTEKTMEVVVKYYKIFIGGSPPELIKERDRRSFIKFSERIDRLIVGMPLSREQMITVAFDCLQRTFDHTDIIYPAHLANHSFLDIALPQALRNIF